MIEHPRQPLEYANAIKYVEDWLNKNHLTDYQRERSFGWHVYDYHDGNAANLIKRPWTGVRVSEVDISCSTGGGSYMQVDMPWGVAFCGQVERCILALVECWNEPVQKDSDGTEWGDTDSEFWRLGYLIEQANKVEA